MAWRHVVLDVVAGSSLVPRPARWLLYRVMGLDIETMNVFSGARITGREVRIGRGTFVNHQAYLDAAAGRIEIGRNCHLGPQVMVLTASHVIDTDGSASSESTYSATRIGDDVWLGARVTVLPGAVIESHSVVAAGAVVTGHCAGGGVYGGVPAKFVRSASPPRSPTL